MTRPGRGEALVLAVLGAGVGAYALLRLVPHLAPFLLALLLAYLIDPAVNALEARGVPRGAAVLLVLALGAAGAVLAGSVLVARLAAEGRLLLEWAPRLAEQVAAASTGLDHLLTRLGLPLSTAEVVRSQVLQVVLSVEALGRTLRAGLRALPGFLLDLCITVVATFFLARDKSYLARTAISTLPAEWQPRARRLKREVVAGVVGFIRSQLLLVACTALLSAAALWVAGHPLALVLGVTAGLLDLVPMVGPAGVFAPLVATRLLGGQAREGWLLAGLFAAVLGVRQVLEPRLVGRLAGLHPLTALASMYLGARLAGPAGLFAGPFCAVACKAIYLGLAGTTGPRRGP